MNTKLLQYIKKYKNMIILEQYEHIINEMLFDLKEVLLNESVDIDINYSIIETFYNINVDNAADKLNELENLLESSGISISNIKASFNSKHEKLVQRDKKWLNSNKNKILEIDYEGTELEVLNDYKVTFEQLLNRYSIFEKAFNGEEINLSKFKDKRDDLKNGLDNYFRSGASYREVGLKRVKGEEAKLAVESIISYCESFLNDKKMIEDKMNAVIVAISDSSVKESMTPIETLKVLLEADDALKEIEQTSKELSKMSSVKSTEKSSTPENTPEKVDVTKDNKEPKEDVPEEKENKDQQPEKVDVTKDNKEPEEEIQEDIPEEKEDEPVDNNNDRQIGIAVLLSVIEARYFDYIDLLKGLIEE